MELYQWIEECQDKKRIYLADLEKDKQDLIVDNLPGRG